MDKHMAGMLAKVMEAKASGKLKPGQTMVMDENDEGDKSDRTLHLAQAVLDAVKDEDADALADALKQLVSDCMDSK